MRIKSSLGPGIGLTRLGGGYPHCRFNTTSSRDASRWFRSFRCFYGRTLRMVKTRSLLALFAISVVCSVWQPAWGQIGGSPLPNDKCCNPPTYGEPDSGGTNCGAGGPCSEASGTCGGGGATVPGATESSTGCGPNTEMYCGTRKVYEPGLKPGYVCTEISAGCSPGQVSCVWISTLWNPDNPPAESGDFTCTMWDDECGS